MDFLSILKRYWGYDSFRPLQQEVIERVCAGAGDTLVLLPTGGGKSLLYQLPTMAMGGVCIVVTPLISLMKDQVDRLARHGIKAVAVHSGLGPRQIDIALDNCVYGDVRFLYVAPERLSSEIFRMRVMKMNVTLLAVDEAHCISEWGYDFRPSYLRIAEIRRLIPSVPLIALTASATEKVCEDICEKLLFRDGRTVRGTFARRNLSYSVRHTDDKEGQLLRIISKVPGSGIVYVRTRDGAERLAALLQNQEVSADSYHGGMTHIMRSIRQDAWSQGKCRVMVATNAFGMGIDKADVRFVVHWDLCDSVEAYYQEAGRAGRDGRRAYAVLLVGSDERERAAKRFEVEFPTPERIRECYDAVCNFLQVGIGDGKHASFSFNPYEFASRNRIFSQTAINALKILQQNGYLILTDENDNPPRLVFTVGRDDLYRVRIEREELDHILRVILRLYQGVFSEFVSIDIAEIAQASGYTSAKVGELLQRLWQLRIIKYIPGNRSPLLILTEERLPTEDVIISHQSYKMRKDMAAERLAGIFAYAANEERCRSALLSEYFGERDAPDCGGCDVCLRLRREPTLERRHSQAHLGYAERGGGRQASFCLPTPQRISLDHVAHRSAAGTPAAVRGIDGGGEGCRDDEIPMSERILAVLAACGGSLRLRELVGRFDGDPSAITATLDRMAEDGAIFIDDSSTVRING